ncbi:MAG: aminopeptidase P N-terminal domain-containing protein [Clostridiales bacterium]|jgi:Xaa-Pro aminopeptidase|nr:aminopeptidase P N-terminal domain-containing protein [Clostridiales bacterium]
MSKLFKENRKRLAKEMGDSSLFIAFSGRQVISSGDQHYPFTPSRNFFYLTGIERPGLIVAIHKSASGEVKETLYLERYDELAAKWNGAALSEDEAKKISGIEDFRLLEQFDGDMARFINYSDKLKVCMDMENPSFDADKSNEVRLAARIRENWPCCELVNFRPVFAKLRQVKSKEEAAMLRKAISITRDGLYLMYKNSRPGMYEYEYEAYFDFHLKKSGVTEHGFNTIAAAGKNATVLHYHDNNSKAADGDLILFDLGAAWNHYSADISRTIPVNGVFTPRQRELYNIVLEAGRKVIAKIKPGVTCKELNDIVVEFYEKELKRIGLIKEKDEVKKYYYHSVSHHLGLNTHDISKGRDAELKKGMVITVEPGLYVAEEGIGIRIEDDVMVLEDGCEVLSEDIIRTPDEIEAFMAEGTKASKRRNPR